MPTHDEASNILRRFIAVVTKLDTAELSHLPYTKEAARSLRPKAIRQLADEVHEAMVRRSHENGLVATVIRPGDPPRPRPLTPVTELRGLAKSITKYGGPDAVRRDADPRSSNGSTESGGILNLPTGQR